MAGLVPVIAHAQTSQQALANLAARITEKRSQVESLSTELELAKTEYNEQLRSLATQQADVEAQINREEIRLDQVNQDISEYRARVEEARDQMADIEPLIGRVLLELKIYMQKGLPFKVPDRVAEVETLETMLVEQSLDTGRLLARVWNLLESEFRMTSESGLYKQSIFINGEEQLAEVARLGMTFMYFKTLDEKFGYVVPAGDGGEYRFAVNRDDEQKIAILFDSLRKNLREGYFDLPNPMGKMSER
jgi:hypothetical protein